MIQKKIRYAIQYDHTKDRGEINLSPSETIPGQAMSVPEMIKRSQAGLPVQGIKVPMYTGEQELPDFANMDISELHDFRRANEEAMRKYQAAVKKKEREAYDKKIADAAAKRVKADLEARAKAEAPDNVVKAKS